MNCIDDDLVYVYGDTPKRRGHLILNPSNGIGFGILNILRFKFE